MQQMMAGYVRQQDVDAVPVSGRLEMARRLAIVDLGLVILEPRSGRARIRTRLNVWQRCIVGLAREADQAREQVGREHNGYCQAVQAASVNPAARRSACAIVLSKINKQCAANHGRCSCT
jgi:hypothetical protein